MPKASNERRNRSQTEYYYRNFFKIGLQGKRGKKGKKKPNKTKTTQTQKIPTKVNLFKNAIFTSLISTIPVKNYT